MASADNYDEACQEDTESYLFKPGYLVDIRLEDGYNVKNLNNGFSWNNIPMLAVITGKNGCGKTAILDTIMEGVERILLNHNLIKVHLKLKENTDGNLLQVIRFDSEISEKKSSGGIFGSKIGEEKSPSGISDLYQEAFELRYEDLMRYSRAKTHGRTHMCQPLFSQHLHMYERIIAKADEMCLPKEGRYISDTLYDTELKRQLRVELGYYVGNYRSLDTIAKFLFERQVPIDSLNKHLNLHGSKFAISCSTFVTGVYTGLAFDVKENGHRILLESLSPGERLELLTLFWLYESYWIAKPQNGAVFLMDEPDAHLHPSLARELIEIIKNRLVKQLGIQVIMTTHNPTTVSLVPENSIFVMTQDSSSHQVTVNKSISKRPAIQLLTSHFVHVNQPFKIVFVEAEDDKKFYQMLYNHLMDRHLISREFPLLFVCHGKNKREKQDGAVENSCRLMVERLVETCVDTKDNNCTLIDYVFGLVDNDNDPLPQTSNVKCLDRYSIENYIFDPVYIYFFLKRKSENLCQDVDEALHKILNEDDPPDRLSKLLVMQDVIKQTEILQTIIDIIADKLIKTVDEYILQHNESKVQDSLNRFKCKPKTLVDKNGKLIRNKVKIQFVGDVHLNYYEVLLRMKGHHLVKFYRQIFPTLTDKNGNMMNSLLRKEGLLIPLEIIQVFREIQSVENLATTAGNQDDSSGSNAIENFETLHRNILTRRNIRETTV